MTWHGEYREAESLWPQLARATIIGMCFLAVPTHGWWWACELYHLIGGKLSVSIGLITVFLVLPFWRFHLVWRLPRRRQGLVRAEPRRPT